MRVRNKNTAYKQNQYKLCMLFCIIQIISSNISINTNKLANDNNAERNFNKNITNVHPIIEIKIPIKVRDEIFTYTKLNLLKEEGIKFSSSIYNILSKSHFKLDYFFD